MQTKTTTKVAELVERFDGFHQELLDFIQTCNDTNWGKNTSVEKWLVGVTAHHVGAAHYPSIEWIQLLVEEKPLLPITIVMIDQMNAQHAQEHQACTQHEVSELLRTNHATVMAYLKMLNDEDLGRQGYVKVFETTMSAGELFTLVNIDNSIGHLASMRKAVRERLTPRVFISVDSP